MNDHFKLFVPLRKVEEQASGDLVLTGVLVKEEVDKAEEIFDYATSKPYVEEWTKSFSEATRTMGVEESAGNLRVMHRNELGGKFTKVTLNDDLTQVDVEAVVPLTLPDVHANVLKGLFTGFSIGGHYMKKWADETLKKTRYTGKPSEGSLADSPCGPSATFALRRADGAEELLKFAIPGEDRPLTKEEQAAEEAEFEAAITATESALQEMKTILAELGAISGIPDTWTLQSVVDGMRSLRDIMAQLKQKQVEQSLAASAPAPAQKTEPNPPPAVQPETMQKAEPTDALQKILAGQEALKKAIDTTTGKVEDVIAKQEETSKRLDGIDGRLQKVEATPAAAGTPVAVAEKTLAGAAPEAKLPTPMELKTAVDEMERKGLAAPQAIVEMRKGLAALAVLQATRG